MARINPRVDIAFKKIFGVEETKICSCHFDQFYCQQRRSGIGNYPSKSL